MHNAEGEATSLVATGMETFSASCPSQPSSLRYRAVGALQYSVALYSQYKHVHVSTWKSARGEVSTCMTTYYIIPCTCLLLALSTGQQRSPYVGLVPSLFITASLLSHSIATIEGSAKQFHEEPNGSPPSVLLMSGQNVFRVSLAKASPFFWSCF